MKKHPHKKRRRNRWPLVLMFIAVLLATAFILLRFVFVVRSVDVSGGANLSAEEVIRHAHIGFGESIFAVDADEIRRSVNSTGTLRFEGLEKQWPDTLVLRVSDRSAASMAFHGGKLLILDADACAMQSLVSAPNADLIFVSDFDIAGYAVGETVSADQRQIDAYCAVMQAVAHHGAAGYISELQIGNPDDLRIITRRGIEVLLGNDENMTDKIAWLKSAVSDLENRRQTGGILDVSSGTKADYRASN